MKQLLLATLIFSTSFLHSQDFSLIEEQIFENDLKEAKTSLQKIIKEDQLNAEAHYWLGAVLHRAYCNSVAGDSKDDKIIVDAGISFEKAKFLDPSCLIKADEGKQLSSYSGKVFNLGVTHFQSNNVEMAFTFFKMSVEATDWLGEIDEEALFYTGLCANKLDDASTAKEYLEQALAKDPSSVEVVKELLKAKISLGELAEGKELLKSSLTHHPDEESLWKELVLLGVKMEDNEEALAAAQTLSHLDSGNPQNLAFLASLYDQSGNTEKAINSYSECLNVDPNHPKVSYNLGVLLYNDAISVLNMAPSEEDKNKAIKKLVVAKSHLENAQKLDPNNMDISTILKNIQSVN